MQRNRNPVLQAVVLALLALTSNSVSPANATENCSGGRAFELLEAGNDSEGSGLGGTGHSDARASGGALEPYRRAGDDESGVGGTGLRPGDGDDAGSGVGGTGIFGRVSRTNGLCVNGFEIRVPTELALESSGDSTADAADSADAVLAVGQLVWIRAENEDGQLIAKRIVIQTDGERSDAALVEKVLRQSHGLDYVSIETDVGGSLEHPRLGGIEFAEGPTRDEAIREGLRPGARVRVGGRLDASGRFEVAAPPRLDRPRGDVERDRNPTLDDFDPAVPPARENPDLSRPESRTKKPRPAVDRPRPTTRPDRPERPRRPRPPLTERPIDLRRR